jgi:GNAT superfamily N-acetyltransferase
MNQDKAFEKVAKVEKITNEDINEILTLRYKELLELIPDSFEGASNQDVLAMNETFEKQITNGFLSDDVFVAKATLDGNIVSVGAVSIIDFPPTPENQQGKAGYIHTMYTMPEHRRKGLAKQILDCLVGWCKQKGMNLVLLAASDEGMKLYSSSGFLVWNTWMYLEPIGKDGDNETKNCKYK